MDAHAVAAAAASILQDAACEAAGVGDTNRLRELLASGARPNGKDRTGWTPLHRAAVAGAAETVAYLLTLDADPNSTDSVRSLTPHGWNPHERECTHPPTI